MSFSSMRGTSHGAGGELKSQGRLNKMRLESRTTELKNFKRETERMLKDTAVYWGYEQSPKPNHS